MGECIVLHCMTSNFKEFVSILKIINVNANLFVVTNNFPNDNIVKGIITLIIHTFIVNKNNQYGPDQQDYVIFCLQSRIKGLR